MSQFFWESTQKARKEHFCDHCHNWIVLGEVYERKIWVPRRGSFLVMREHVDPPCPPNFEEEIHQEALQQDEAVLGDLVELEIRTKTVVLLQVNGEITVRYEPEIVPVIVPVVSIREEENYDGDWDEIPF